MASLFDTLFGRQKLLSPLAESEKPGGKIEVTGTGIIESISDFIKSRFQKDEKIVKQPSFTQPTQRKIDTNGKTKDARVIKTMATQTPFDTEIESVFADQAGNAKNVLRRENDEKIVGENVSFETGQEVDFTNENGSIDRGLFRINSNTFFDFMSRKPEVLANVGILEWNDMLDPAKNIEMAKIIFEEQGWDAWVAAPANLLSKKEKERRKERGIQIIQ